MRRERREEMRQLIERAPTHPFSAYMTEALDTLDRVERLAVLWPVLDEPGASECAAELRVALEGTDAG